MLYLEATEKASKPDKLKVAILLNFIGEEALKVFNTFHLKEDEGENFDLVINKFDNFCEPKKNVIFERFKFFSATQKDGESIDSFITELKGLSTSCEFESQKESLIRDRIVYGIQDKALQERLLREPNLTLLKAIEMCKTDEISKKQIKIMQNNQNICQIRKYEKKHSPKQNQESEKEFKCQRCGKSHRAKYCPAWGKRCSKCKKMNHFAAFFKCSAIKSLNDETEETVWSIHEAKVVHTLEWKKIHHSEWKGNMFQVGLWSRRRKHLDYLVEIKRLASSCNFGNFLEDSLRDKMVCGLYNAKIQNRILSEGDISLAKVIEIALSMEVAEKNTKLFHLEQGEDCVDKLRMERKVESNFQNGKCKHCEKNAIGFQLLLSSCWRTDPTARSEASVQSEIGSSVSGKTADPINLRRSLRLKGLPPEPELHQTSPIMLKSESGEETPAQVPSAYFSLQQPKCPSTFSGDGSEDSQRWLKDYKRIAQYNRWDNPMCLANAIFFLAGTARQWYENNEDVLTSWEVFQRALGETFGQQEEEIKKAEALLKIRAQKANESSESYIQDVLYLCQLIDPRMDNETKLGHLMKGVAEDVYQILIARDVDNVEQFLSQCRKIELLKKRRITTKKFERLPNVTSMACEEDELSSLIRRIVQEEVQRAFSQPMHTTDSLEEIIREEVKKNLAPISRTTTSPMMKQPRPAPTYDQAGRTFYNSSASLPKAREWRTPDDRPVCFHCGRPGHVVRYCRERRQIFANVRTRRDARRPVTLGDYMPNADGTGSWSPPNRGLRILALVDSGADYSVISEDFRCRIRTPMLSSKGPIIRVANSKCVRALGKCVLRIKVNELTQPFEFLVLSQCSHCVILGWDFLKLTQAEINCEHDELYLKDAPMKEEPHPVDTFHTLKDNIIPPNSIKQITVVCSDVPGVQEVAITCSKGLTLEKEIVIPASIVSLNHGRGKVWVVNGTNYAKIIPEGMKVAELSIIDNSYVCCLDGDDDYLNQKEDKCSTQNTGDLDRLVSLMDTDLSHEDRNRLLDVLRRFIGVFELQKAGPKRTSLDVKHRIDTGDHAPIRQRPYRVSPYERGVIQTEVDKMLKSGIVKPSDSPWSSPVVLVKKKDGTWRFCVDYRRLNKITRKDVYPLPRIDDTLDSLKGASVFSTMDLKSGYWQIEVDEADREKTAFVTPDGLFEFKVMPFGLCNAPATFERIMDNLLRGLKWNICLCYLDDIIVFSKTMEEHILRLEMVLNCLSKAGLTLNLEKCHFGSRRMKVLGHLIDGDGIYPDPDKVEAVRNFLRPKNVSEVRSFLGLCSYYRRFIKSFADITGPLNELLKKGKQFSWNDRQEDSFNNLKSALTSEPVLGHFDEAAPIYVHTDASGFGIGSVLVQLRDGCEQPIAYASRTLSKSEKNYSTTEKECLAVVWSISKFRPYLFGSPFSVVTDHHSLCWLANLKDPSGRLARWALRLQEYEVAVCYKNGRKHKDADCLSRSPLPDTAEETEEDILCLPVLCDVEKEQQRDPSLTKIIANCGDPNYKRFVIINNILYKKNYDPLGRPWLLVVPRTLRLEVLRSSHDAPTAGHLGFAKTYDRIRRRFFWPGLYRSVRNYVGHCRECQRRKKIPQLPPGNLKPIAPVSIPFQKIGMDLLGRFPPTRDGNRWVIVCTDYLTKYAVTKAIPTGGAVEVAKFMVNDVVLKHGAPRELITDRGRSFQAKVVNELTKMCGMSHYFTTAYHPQTNGLTERLNKTLVDMLSMYVDVDQKNWDSVLPFITFAYNTARQETTGFSPFFLVHGREAETMLDALFPYQPDYEEDEHISHLMMDAEEARQLARLQTLKAQAIDKERYDSRHKPVYYDVGDLVWVFTPVRKVGLSEKLLKKYFGPYRITKKLSDVNYEVTTVDESRRKAKYKDVVHVLRMKPYNDPETQNDEYLETVCVSTDEFKHRDDVLPKR
ncbi:hypothetical protein LAZ67_X004064, partial [Cordylochernes scorpioides]